MTSLPWRESVSRRNRARPEGRLRPVETFEEFQLWRLITGAFLHDPENWWHIVWNMLFLWWFGKDIEAMYGWKEFLAWPKRFQSKR